MPRRLLNSRSKKKNLAKLIDEDWQKAAKELSELKITQLSRQSIPETIYDVAMYYDRNNKRLLSDTYSWSTSLDPDGRLVSLGYFDAGACTAAGGGLATVLAVSAFPFPADCNFGFCYLIL